MRRTYGLLGVSGAVFVALCAMSACVSTNATPGSKPFVTTTRLAGYDGPPTTTVERAAPDLGWAPLIAGVDYEPDPLEVVVETFPHIGRPRLRIDYTSPSGSELLFIQGSIGYAPELDGTESDVTIGAFDVTLREAGGNLVGTFPTGESYSDGEPVIGIVITQTYDELTDFVRSLSRTS